MCLILTPQLSPVLQFPSKASAWGKGGGSEDSHLGRQCGSEKETGQWGPAWGSNEEGAEITEQHLLCGS